MGYSYVKMEDDQTTILKIPLEQLLGLGLREYIFDLTRTCLVGSN